MSENDSERVKSKAMIDSSDSDSDMSDSEFQNVAKKPKLDLSRVRIQNQDMKVTMMMIDDDACFFHRNLAPPRPGNLLPAPVPPGLKSGIRMAVRLPSPSKNFHLH